ncbi:MAG TPA: hypothetical protein VLJ76_08055, partial [Gaiellaceae bacterium]|nr:hypothetical protein [Gaiellaceae bacterium]
MRFADRLVSPPARAGAALAALALLVLSVASGASPAKKPPQKIGGVTAVPNRSVFVGTGKGKGQPVYSSDNKDPNSKKEFHPLYAGNTITATGTGVGYFHLHLKSTDLYCSIGVNGPETGTVMVAPPNGDDIDLEHSGVLKCATTATAAKKTIGAPTGVKVRAADPVFTVAATPNKVVVAVRRGAATVVGKDAHKGVVVGVNTDQS